MDVQKSESVVTWYESDASNQNAIASFRIAVLQRGKRIEGTSTRRLKKIASFPFAGTLKQTHQEAMRISSCFDIKVKVEIRMWFESYETTTETIS